MGCSCAGQIDNVQIAVKETTAAVNACCDRIIDYYNMTSENIGQGLDSVAEAMSACCDTWAMAGQVDINIPEQTVSAACPDGSSVDVTIPGQTVSAPNWASAQLYGQLASVNQQTAASTLYNEQYNAWLEEYKEWQDFQILTQLPAVVGQLLAITEMYDQYNKYMTKTNQIYCDLADNVYPTLSADYAAIEGDYSEHVDLLKADFADTLGLVNDRLEWHCDEADKLRDAYFDEGAGGVETGYATIEKQHASNMSQNMANIADVAQSLAQQMSVCLQDMKASGDATFEAFRTAEFDNIVNIVNQLTAKAADICAYLNDCGQELVDNYTDNQLPAVNTFTEQAVVDATACLAMIQDSIADADTFFQDQSDLYAAYREQELATGPGIIQQARDILESGPVSLECFNLALRRSEDFEQKYNVGWAVDAEALAGKILQQACALADGFEDQYEYKDSLSRQCLQHFDDHYADCDGVLGAGIMAEAKLLMAERKASFDTFVQQQEDWYACWTTYKALEEDYAGEIISKGAERVCKLHDEVDTLCVEADEYLECMRTLSVTEKQLLPKINLSGITACEQQIDTYEGLDNMFDKLWDQWCNVIMPCDEADIAQLCGVLDKRDLACEIDDNNQCATELAEAAKNCYLDFGIACEKEYLQELCDMVAYSPDFCALEDRAVAHVRRSIDLARENLLRAGNRFCVGAMEEELRRLETEGARLESQAISAANRFERWWQTQEDDRRHRYKFDMISAISALGQFSLAGLGQSTQGYDAMLTQIHSRLNRSFQYLTNANSAGSTAANSTAAGVAQSLNSAQTGHWYGDMHRLMKASANDTASGLLLRAQEQTRIGHDYAGFASGAQVNAEGVARESVQDGLNAMQHGRQFKNMAGQIAGAASADLNSAQGLALQHIDDGQFWIREARANKSDAWNVVNQALNNSQQSINAGHAVLNDALRFESHRDNLIQQCKNNGDAAAAHQLEIMQVGERKIRTALQSATDGLARSLDLLSMGLQDDRNWMEGYRSLVSFGPPASNALSGIFTNGHNLMGMSHTMASMGMNHKQAMCEKICDAVRDRDVARMQQLMGFNSLAGNTGAMASQFGGGLANAFDGLVGSISALGGTPPSILQFQNPGGTQTQFSGSGSGTINSHSGFQTPGLGQVSYVGQHR